jgi:hypothetical protein
MCTELILAIIYFLIIFIVDFFLYKLLKNYFKNIFYLKKLQSIFNNIIKNSNNINQKNDLLIIQDIYQNLKENKVSEISINYYLNLFEKQYS